MSIQELIDKQLVSEQESRTTRERSGLWNPSMFGCCYRRQWFNRTNTLPSDPFDNRTLRVFKAGNLFEKFVIDLYLIQNPTAQTQVLIKTEDICGYADLVEEEIVSDIKSQHSKSFWYMTKSEDIRKDKYNNWLQVMWYAWELQLPKGKLCFISKDDLCIQEYIQDFEDGYWIDELAKEMANLTLVWKEEMPKPKPRLYGKNKDDTPRECGWCLWKTLCFKLQKEE